METINEKNTATFIHLSALSQYLIPFIPFINFILPIIIWSSKKDKSDYIDFHGKQIINFQLSLFLYCMVIIAISLPVLFFTVLSSTSFEIILNHNDIAFSNLNFMDIIRHFYSVFLIGLLVVILKIVEFILIIVAALNASNGKKYSYPLTITFIK